MLGDLRILAVGADRAAAPAELLLDTERVALQALFDMIRRFKVGYDVELHKRTLERGLLSLIGPDAEGVAGAGGAAPRPSTPTRPLQIGGDRARWRCAPTSASTCSATRARRDAAERRAARARRRGRLRAGGRVPARRARPAALRDRPRRHA